MRNLELTSQVNTGFIEVSADFIDFFMPEADSVSLKVYLYLLRAFKDASILISVSDLADLFDVTPNKIIRALSYWEEKGLLSLSYTDNTLSGITLLPIRRAESAPVREVRPEPTYKAPVPETVSLTSRTPAPVIHQDAPLDLSQLEQDGDFAILVKLLERYTKKPITAIQYEALGDCYFALARSYELTEYLIEYCVDEGHTSLRYMKSVANGWASEGLSSLDEVKQYCQDKRKRVYTVRKALGITNRSLVQEEIDYIDRWMQHFSLELIQLACARTISMTGSPSFRYTDTILSAWREANVHSKEDVEHLDLIYEQNKKTAKPAGNPGREPQANFPQRNIDYNAMASQFYE